MERDVGLQRLQTQRGVVVDVALAELDEAAVGARQASPFSISGPASEFSTTSTPRPFVTRNTSSAKPEASRREHVLDAVPAQIGAPLRRAGRRNDRALTHVARARSPPSPTPPVALWIRTVSRIAAAPSRLSA